MWKSNSFPIINALISPSTSQFLSGSYQDDSTEREVALKLRNMPPKVTFVILDVKMYFNHLNIYKKKRCWHSSRPRSVVLGVRLAMNRGCFDGRIPFVEVTFWHRIDPWEIEKIWGQEVLGWLHNEGSAGWMCFRKSKGHPPSKYGRV